MTRQEISEMVTTEGKNIYGFCYKLTQNRHDADDLYQETFLKAMERCSKIDSSNNPKSFLISISVGIWKNNRKKYARRQRIAPIEKNVEDWDFPTIQENSNSPEEILIFEEVQELVRMETAALSDKFRIPVYMYYTAEMSIESISEALRIPSGTVKSRLHRARNLIKKGLEEHGYEG